MDLFLNDFVKYTIYGNFLQEFFQYFFQNFSTIQKFFWVFFCYVYSFIKKSFCASSFSSASAYTMLQEKRPEKI